MIKSLGKEEYLAFIAKILGLSKGFIIYFLLSQEQSFL